MAYTTSVLNDKTAGEDIAQEVFVYIWDKREKLHFTAGFYSYLFQSAYSRCIDYLKKSKLSEKYVQSSLLHIAEEHRTYLEDDCAILQDIYSRTFNERLNELLKQLPEARRTAFELSYKQGLKAKEVADAMKIPQRTVESHIYLTIKFLKKHLSPADLLLLAIFYKIL